MSILSYPENLIIFPILLATFTAFLNVLIEKIIRNKKLSRKLINGISITTSLLIIVIIGLIIEYFLTTSNFISIKSMNSDFIFIKLTIDSIGLFFISIMSVIFSFTVWFSIVYMKNDETPGIFFGLLFTIFIGLYSIFSTSDFFTLFIAWELMSLASYALVTYDRKVKESLEAGLKYLIMSSFGSLSFLYGFSIIYGKTGSLEFGKISIGQDYLYSLALVCIIIGFGFNAGFIFLNQWLPDAHPSAPSPVSALLSGIVVKTGIYGIFRSAQYLFPSTLFSSTFNLSEWSFILIIIGIATIFEGTILFIIQLYRKDLKDFKRILAYSTVIHLGYIILGLGVGGTQGVTASLFYILNHAFTKGMLFLASGYLIIRFGTRNLDLLKGIGRKDTYIGIVLAIGIMSLSGLPGTGGFIAKIMIIFSLATTYQTFGLLTFLLLSLVIISSAIAFITGLWLLKYFILEEYIEEEPLIQIEEISSLNIWSMRVILGIMMLVTIFLGFIPGPVIETISSL